MSEQPHQNKYRCYLANVGSDLTTEDTESTEKSK